jgi:hypothetical protein
LFYRFSDQTDDLDRPFAIKSTQNTGSILYDCDFTLAFLAFLVVASFFTRLVCKGIKQFNSLLLTPFLENATFEILFFGIA